MNENDLNIEYICEKTLLNKGDELVPIILDLIQESYKAGLCQAEFDNTMNLIEENEELKKQLEEYQLQNINLRADIMIQKMAFPNELIKDKTFYNLYNMPTYVELLVQQKKFIKYLEDEIEKATTNPYTKLSEYGMNRIHIYKEILQKYKEIIGDDK